MKKTILSVIALFLTLGVVSSCSLLSESFGILLDAIKGDVRVLTPFDEMTYVRPDYQELDRKIDEMSEKLKSGEGKRSEMKALLSDIVDAYYYELYTMNSLAFLAYSQDITNEERRNEYYAIMAETERLGARLDELYYLCAESKFKSDFENEIMGAGFFELYEGGAVSYPAELTALFERESELLMSYSEEMADIHVEYEGTVYTDEMIDGIVDEALYQAVCRVYYDTYNTRLGQLYIELVKVRQKIAAYFGYDHYAEYAYANLYGREYTVAEAEQFLAGIQTYLVPVYRDVSEEGLNETFYAMTSMEPETTKVRAKTLVDAMSEELGEIYDEMLNKRLCTVASSDSMYYGSFQIYLNQYETPYLFVNGVGQISDLLTVVHEFGHFSSAYYNYGSTGSNDESEVASQGLELMALRYLDTVLEESDAALLRKYELYTILSSLNDCAAYTQFENYVYADTTPTLEECNQYFQQCMEAYGIVDPSRSGFGDHQYWVFINHFIEYPYYMIGYSVSADVAVQLYELGKEEGMDTYQELISLAYQYDFFGNLEEVGLVSPFEAEQAKVVADFFARELGGQ